MSANPWDDVLAQRHGDKLKPESNSTTATETEAQIGERVRREEARRAEEVTLACSIAGQPSRAPAFLAEGKTVSEVLALLASERARVGAQRKGEDVEAFAARRGVRRI